MKTKTSIPLCGKIQGPGKFSKSKFLKTPHETDRFEHVVFYKLQG